MPYSTFAASVLVASKDYAARYVGLLLTQFRWKPRIEGLLQAFIAESQETENMLNALYRAFSLADAVGDQLDLLGSLLQVPREGWPDAVYRTRLRVEILILASNGTPEDLLGIIVAAISPGVEFTYEEQYPGSVVVEIVDAVPEFLPPEVLRFLNRARDVGVRIGLVHTTTDAANSFTFAVGLTEEVDVNRGFGDTADATVGGLLAGAYS